MIEKYHGRLKQNSRCEITLAFFIVKCIPLALIDELLRSCVSVGFLDHLDSDSTNIESERTS